MQSMLATESVPVGRGSPAQLRRTSAGVNKSTWGVISTNNQLEHGVSWQQDSKLVAKGSHTFFEDLLELGLEEFDAYQTLA